MANFRYMGIKRKVLLGCIVLALILLISSSISMFEFTRMNDHVTELISDNTKSIEISRELLAKAEEYNLRLMHLVVGEVAEESIEVINDDEFISFFSGIRESFVTEQDKANADSVMYAFTAYMHVVREHQIYGSLVATISAKSGISTACSLFMLNSMLILQNLPMIVRMH